MLDNKTFYNFKKGLKESQPLDLILTDAKTKVNIRQRNDSITTLSITPLSIMTLSSTINTT
jgi:hypothetical protein